MINVECRHVGGVAVNCLFKAGQGTIWSASVQAGRLYVATTKCLAAGGGHPSGLKTLAEDVFELDPRPFADLVSVVYKEYFASTDHVYRGLLHGWLLTSLVLLARVDVTVDAQTDQERELVRDMCEHAKAMPS